MLYIIVIAYVLGIIWGLYIKNIASIFFIVTVIVLGVYILKNAGIINNEKKHKKNNNKKKQIVAIFIIVFLLSLIRIVLLESSFNSLYKELDNNSNINVNEKNEVKNEVEVEAIVISSIKEKQYKNQYIIKVESINKDKKYKNTVQNACKRRKKMLL